MGSELKRYIDADELLKRIEDDFLSSGCPEPMAYADLINELATRQADTTLERVKGFYLGLSCFAAQLRDDSDLRDGVMRVLQMMRDDFPELLEGQSKETG